MTMTWGLRLLKSFYSRMGRWFGNDRVADACPPYRVVVVKKQSPDKVIEGFSKLFEAEMQARWEFGLYTTVVSVTVLDRYDKITYHRVRL